MTANASFVGEEAGTMRYEEIRRLPEGDDPSVSIETERLVAKVIDNTELFHPNAAPHFSDAMTFGAFTHHFGYHGIRALWDRTERRNIVVPFAGILNWQLARMGGVESDPVDERAAFGIPRGWPIAIRRDGPGAVLEMAPLDSLRVGYRLAIYPAADGSPDALDFSVRFTFNRPDPPRAFSASWACYLAGWDSVAMHYPRRMADGGYEWTSVGDPPDMVIGEPVGYVHDQRAYMPDDVALPMAYVRIGERAVTLMFRDPSVRLFVVNAGGHLFSSPVQCPALDFAWSIDDYPAGEPVGFDGRLVYAPFAGDGETMRRYDAFRDDLSGKGATNADR